MILILSAAFLIMSEGCLLYKLYQCNISQDEKVLRLECDINTLNEEISKLELDINTLKFAVLVNAETEWSEESFNYLALGNSITKHGICSYWFDEVGMAATSERNDYFHLVCNDLQKITKGEQYNADLKAYAYNFSAWENQVNDRTETLDALNGILDEKIDLITIQLGENVNSFETLEEDYEELLVYIKGKCPNTEIIVVGNFWNAPECENIKTTVTKKLLIDYVDLTEIWDNDEYMAGMGTIVYDADGKMHMIEHEGVAKHPNDKGMKYIADSIVNIIKEKWSR